MSQAALIWKKVLDMLSKQLTSTTMNTFFEGTEGIDINGSSIAVSVRSVVAKEAISTHYIKMIEDCLYQLFSVPISCVLLAGEDEIYAYSAGKSADSGFLTSNEFTFSTFVVGPSNRFAHAAAIAVSENPAASYNPLFIYGGSGLGKTHLLYAIAHRTRQINSSKKIIYKRGEDFTNELISAIRAGKNVEFREKYRSADLFLIDDTQFIAGKDSTQEEFFHTFNTLYEAGKQIVLTADRPPKEMTRLEDRLKSRFEWGLLCDIQPPDLETRIAIIRNKATAIGLEIDDEAVMFIAENITANVRQIEGVVKKLQAYKNLLGANIDINTVSKAIRDIFQENPGLNPTPEIIIEETEKFYGLNEGELTGGNRSRTTAQARHIAVYLTRMLTKLSLPDIGNSFKRHHSTIMHSIELIESMRKEDPKLNADINDLIDNIKNHR